MNYIFWLYLASRLDALQGIFIGTVVCCGMVAGITFFVWMVAEGDFNPFADKFKSHRRNFFILLAVALFGLVLTPSKNDVMFIVGGAGVIEAAKAVAGSEVAKTSVSVIEKWLKEQERALEKKAK